MTLLNQLPRFSAYDEGSFGEGTLDPLGLSPGAERIAELLAPGLRARMSEPRFVTLAAVGAIAKPEHVADTNGPAPDIAFEWLVAEALARDNRTADPQHQFPGSRKVARALRRNERVSASDYLASPRVFGFTGVYRPFSRYAGVTDDKSDEPGVMAVGLVEAWEQDQNLGGFVSQKATSSGGRFRNEISKYVRLTMEADAVTAPASGQFLKKLAEVSAPRGAGRHERGYLRQLLLKGRSNDGEVRDELVHLLAQDPAVAVRSDQELASYLAPIASLPTRRALHAAIAYEDCAAQLDCAFRSILRHGGALHGPFDLEAAGGVEGVADIAARVPALVAAAHSAYAELDNPYVTAADPFSSFSEPMSPAQFSGALIARHENVQADKAKLPWLDDQGDEGWRVRRLFRDQPPQSPDTWLHPMRLNTIARFLEATS